jgi:hypothetical protein
MARKSNPARPARDRSRDDESLLLRSAESLGRMIGSLQRQLEAAAGRLGEGTPDGAAHTQAAAAKRIVKPKSVSRKTTVPRKAVKKR